VCAAVGGCVWWSVGWLVLGGVARRDWGGRRILHRHAAAIVVFQSFGVTEKSKKETIERRRTRRVTVSLLERVRKRVVLCGWKSREP
jgi:hypothetical protein